MSSSSPIHVLRLGHRRARDARITTHVGLVARACGADGITIAEKDDLLEKTLRDVTTRFGGPFEVASGAPWKPFVRKWKDEGGLVIHLTMYGEPFQTALETLPRDRAVLFVVGAEKVPGDLYDLADANVAIGSQPHSEVAALALALDRWTHGGWTEKSFRGTVKIVPNPRGKTLIAPERSPRSRKAGPT